MWTIHIDTLHTKDITVSRNGTPVGGVLQIHMTDTWIIDPNETKKLDPSWRPFLQQFNGPIKIVRLEGGELTRDPETGGPKTEDRVLMPGEWEMEL